MIVVIQCAKSKRKDAGYLLGLNDEKVLFVADPDAIGPDDEPRNPGGVYAHPEDMACPQPGGKADIHHTWRTELLRYNETPDNNPLGLLPAWKLYKHLIYARLHEKYRNRLYILSAGWGMIRADFLTPMYDITFSAQADDYMRRRKKDEDNYKDFRLPISDDPVVFFIGKAYIPLACKLTEGHSGHRYLYYNSATAPKVRGFEPPIKYETLARTNWHYQCARNFVKGEIGVPRP